MSAGGQLTCRGGDLPCSVIIRGIIPYTKLGSSLKEKEIVSLKHFSIILFFVLLSGQMSIAENADSVYVGKSISVVPGPEYKAGWLHTLFFGTQWRSLWTTPLTVPILDLNQYAGGLTPIKRGGGFQTKSLHFYGNDGKFYKFRSINKDPKKVIPQYFRDTFVEDIVQDMISTAHPLSAVIAARLLNAVDVLNSQPQIVELPKDSRLAEYREDFEEVLGTLAENPKDETDPALIFAGADKIVKDYKIFSELEDDNDDQINAPEFLKARLMDVFLGDWDRHIGQWKWARYKKGKKKWWVPIPRDRDQAFARYNGLIPWMVSIAVPQIEGFRENYPQINDITWSGRFLDRRFLVSIEKPTWDSVTTYVQNCLTDAVIEEAVRLMPDEWYEKEGETLIRILKARRDKLFGFSQDYYAMISKYVSIYTSDKNEYAEVKRLDRDRVEVLIYKKDKDSGEKKGKPFYTRTFYYNETKEIRIDLLDGDDTAMISGEVDRSITVYITGGSGKDTIIDQSLVNGYFLSITPFYTADTKSLLYDSGKKTTFVSGSSSKIIRDKASEPKPFNEETDNYNEKYEPQIEDRGHDWKAGFWFGYNSTDGLTFGGGPILYEFGYRVSPYVYRMSLQLAYITNIQTFVLDYQGEFNTPLPYFTSNLNFRKITAHTWFYGFGNETVPDEKLQEMDFYKIRPDLYNLDLIFDYKFNEKTKLWAGVNFDNSLIKFDQNTLLDTLQLKNATERNQIGLNLGFVLDTRDNQDTPMKGAYVYLSSLNYPGWIKTENRYNKLSLDARLYLNIHFITNSSIVFRIIGEKLWGNYPLYRASFLGGPNNLHGYERQRFAGNALAFSAVALRSYLFPLKILFPARLGFSIFAESGRVYYDNDDSKKWHPSAGGGLWLAFLQQRWFPFWLIM